MRPDQAGAAASRSGRLHRRWPVSLNTAAATAGATGGTRDCNLRTLLREAA